MRGCASRNAGEGVIRRELWVSSLGPDSAKLGFQRVGICGPFLRGRRGIGIFLWSHTWCARLARIGRGYVLEEEEERVLMI